jgi:Cu/Ag efflux pump CusA
MFLPKFAIRRPVMVTMIYLVLILLGIISFALLPIDLFPDVDLPMVMVVAGYKGAGPSEIESMVAKPLENALAATKNLLFSGRGLRHHGRVRLGIGHGRGGGGRQRKGGHGPG